MNELLGACMRVSLIALVIMIEYFQDVLLFICNIFCFI